MWHFMKKLWQLGKTLCQAAVLVLPWTLKRWALQRFFGYQLAATARIGYSWVFPKQLIMDEQAAIGHGNVMIHLDRVVMGVAATIARGNWVTGFPKNGARHFQHQPERQPELILGDHAAVTKNHHLDCTHSIQIGRFTTVAGYGSQFLTHSIDVVANRQDSKPIRIGDYCFVGTDCTVLGGASLPDRSVLGAKSLLNHACEVPGQLYAGVPAKGIKALPEDAGYFHRTTGFVE
jgi:serine acetyltransferase